MNPAAGGAELTIEKVGSHLVSVGHQVKILSGGWAGASSSERFHGVEIKRYMGNFTAHLAHVATLAFDRGTYKVIDDLAHVVPWGSERVSRSPGTAFFRHLHARTLFGQVKHSRAVMLERLESMYSRIYQRYPFVVESGSSKSDLSSLGIVPDRIVQIPPGVDRELFHPGERTSSPQLIYFAGMKAYKRPETALLVLGELNKLGVYPSLVVVGDGPSKPGLVSCASTNGLKRSIRFVGRVRRDVLAKLVRESWVNLNFSVSEGWGYSITEAAASGVPTVAFSVPGVADSVVDGQTGLLVPPGDVRAFAREVARVLVDPDTYGVPALERASGRSWEDCGTDWLAHLQALS